MAFRLLLLNIILCALALVVCTAYDVQLSNRKLRRFFSTYDKSVLPSKFNGGRPVTVKIGTYYNQIEVIKEPGRTPKLEFIGYIKMSWVDLRFKALVKSDTPLIMEDGAWKYAWIPDVFSRTSVGATVFREPIDHTLMKVKRDGSVWYVYNMKDRISCRETPGNLTCGPYYESFKYTMKDMVLQWLDNSPVIVDKSIPFEGYSLTDVILDNCSQNYTSGAYNCLEQRFVLKKT